MVVEFVADGERDEFAQLARCQVLGDPQIDPNRRAVRIVLRAQFVDAPFTEIGKLDGDSERARAA